MYYHFCNIFFISEFRKLVNVLCLSSIIKKELIIYVFNKDANLFHASLNKPYRSNFNIIVCIKIDNSF